MGEESPVDHGDQPQRSKAKPNATARSMFHRPGTVHRAPCMYVGVHFSDLSVHARRTCAPKHVVRGYDLPYAFRVGAGRQISVSVSTARSDQGGGMQGCPRRGVAGLVR